MPNVDYMRRSWFRTSIRRRIYDGLCVMLLIGSSLTTANAAQQYFLWAEIDHQFTVEVTYSENAGVPNPIIRFMSQKLQDLQVVNAAGDKYTIKLKDSKHDSFQGTLPDRKRPVVAMGHVSYDDDLLQYTFAAQGYTRQSDWESFFQYLTTNHQFAVLMKSCGPPYTVKVIGGVTANTHVDVCLYEKGGYLIECMSLDKDNTEFQMEMNFQHVDGDAIVYALANTTSTKNGNPIHLYATTSVVLDGPCAA